MQDPISVINEDTMCLVSNYKNPVQQKLIFECAQKAINLFSQNEKYNPKHLDIYINFAVWKSRIGYLFDLSNSIANELENMEENFEYYLTPESIRQMLRNVIEKTKKLNNKS